MAAVTAVLEICIEYNEQILKSSVKICPQGRTHAASEKAKETKRPWYSFGNSSKNGSGSASTVPKHEKIADDIVYVSREGYNVKMIGLAIRIIAEFQEGIPPREVCKLMKLQKKEEANLMTTFEEVKNVFKINIKGGEKHIKFAESFREELSRIEGSGEYKAALQRFTRKSQMTDQTLKQLKALKKQDNLNLDILQGIDDHFQLNGRLQEILSKTCEVLAVSPERITNMDQNEENATSVDEKTDERVQKDEEKAEASAAQPGLMDCISSTERVQKDEKKAEASKAQPGPMDFISSTERVQKDEEKAEASAAQPGLMDCISSTERVQKDEEKAEASKAQSGPMDFSESEDEVKETVISLENVSIFLGTLKTHPEALDAELISLIEQEFKIPDRLLKQLEDMCEFHGKVVQATTGNPTPVNCDTFLDIMGKPTTSLDKALEEAIVSTFGIRALDVSDGLKKICDRIKNKSVAHV